MARVSVARLSVNQLSNITIIRIFGKVSFDELVDAMKQFYPMVVCHIIWDLTDSNFDNVTAGEFRKLPPIAKELLIHRVSGGKTAYVSPVDITYGLLRMYTMIAEHSVLPYERNVFRRIEDAIEWLES